MSRYIDADVLRDKLYEADAVTMRGVAIINNEPTVDAVPVVLCKDCKHHEVFKNGVNGWCNGHGRPTDVTYFCADGERKETDKGDK